MSSLLSVNTSLFQTSLRDADDSDTDATAPEVEPELTQASPTSDAGAPFNSWTADCILRSSDNVEYRVHKGILSVASAVFDSMFSLPTSQIEPSGQKLKDGLPVITLVEPSSILSPLLRLIYPTRMPALTTMPLLTVMSIYDAMDKYAMEDIAQPVLDALFQAAQFPNTAMTMFAFGCRHSLSQLITLSSKETLSFASDALPYTPELNRITGSQMHRLLGFHRRCRSAASKLATKSNWKWIPSLSSIPLGSTTMECGACRMQITMSSEIFPGMGRTSDGKKWVFYCPKWWWDYMVKAEEALKRHPRGKTVKGSGLLGEALAKSLDCVNRPECRKAGKAMEEFSDLFKEAVEKETDKVGAKHSTRLLCAHALTHPDRSRLLTEADT